MSASRSAHEEWIVSANSTCFSLRFISALSASAQVVLTAMKHYGMILADNGSNFYFQGEANAGWTDDDISPLKSVPASAFEAVAVPPLEN